MGLHASSARYQEEADFLLEAEGGGKLLREADLVRVSWKDGQLRKKRTGRAFRR